MVPHKYKQDKSLGRWVSTQRKCNNNNTIRLDRKRILDEIGFAWKYVTLAARAATNDVRGPVIRSFHALLARSCFSLSSPFFCLLLCRIQVRKHSPAVWVSRKKH
jgi:hypothetical protein